MTSPNTGVVGWRATVALVVSVLALVVSTLAALPVVLPYFGYEKFGAKRAAQHNARSYFDAWAAGDIKSLQAMAGRAAPNSPAYKAATAQYAAWEAWTRSVRKPMPKSVVKYSKEYSISVCTPDKLCTIYNDFTFDATSKLLTDYTANGVPIRGNVMGRQGWVQVGSLWFCIAGAWVSVHGGLQVSVEFINNAHSTVTFSQSESGYYDYNDVYHPVSSLVGRTVVRPGQRSLMWLNFPNQVLNGVLAVSYLSAAPNSSRAYQYIDLRAD